MKMKDQKKEATAPTEIWFDVDGELRRLYAIRKNESDKSLFYMDRSEVLELKGRFSPLPNTLTPADIQSVSAMKAKGNYLILSHGGGSWAAYMLRRKYKDAERSLIPPESEEATPATMLMFAPKKDETKHAGAAILREHLVLSPDALPKGPVSEALCALKPDTLQIVNLRLQRNAKGKLRSWREVANLFKREGKENKSYTEERCRQIGTTAVDKNPALKQYVKGLSKRETVKLDQEQEPTDAEEIENITAPKGVFDKNDLSASSNSGYLITKNPRKPV